MDVRARLISAGVKNLRDFGYPSADENNILSDYIFSQFFMSMLQENKGVDSRIDKEIDALLADLSKDKS